MNIAIKYFIVAFLMVTTIHLAAQNPEQSFELGNAHYAEGRYQEAIDAYRMILDNGQESAAVYYNLANAHYKLNNVGPSIYYYEKAKQLAPADSEIKNNAGFAEKMKIDAIDPLPQNTFEKWFNSILSLFTADGWAYMAVVFITLFVLLFLGYYFSFESRKKRSFFVGSFMSLLVGSLALVFAYSAFAKAEKDKPAIVFAVESEVKSEPNLGSPAAFTLHEGTKVYILEGVENWKKILLADGKSGWIPATHVREL